MGTIILRDIPKDLVHLDLMVYQIQGGFRGFEQVPAGPHYVAIAHAGKWPSFWCFLDSADTVVVKQFLAEDQVFVDDTSEAAKTYQQLAQAQAMGAALQPYDPHQAEVWRSLTQYIQPPLADLPTTAQLGGGTVECSRFEQLFQRDYQGNVDRFLADVQFSFLDWWMVAKQPNSPELPGRWPQLLGAIYNAGDRQMSQNPQLFTVLVDVLVQQFSQLPPVCFAKESVIVAQIDYFFEDLTDTDIPALQHQAEALAACVQHQTAT